LKNTVFSSKTFVPRKNKVDNRNYWIHIEFSYYNMCTFKVLFI